MPSTGTSCCGSARKEFNDSEKNDHECEEIVTFSQKRKRDCERRYVHSPGVTSRRSSWTVSADGVKLSKRRPSTLAAHSVNGRINQAKVICEWQHQFNRTIHHERPEQIRNMNNSLFKRLFIATDARTHLSTTKAIRCSVNRIEAFWNPLIARSKLQSIFHFDMMATHLYLIVLSVKVGTN